MSSYSVSQHGTDFFIAAKDKPAAAKALLKYDFEASKVEGAARNPLKKNAKLEDILSEWDWYAELDRDGNIKYFWMESEYLGDEEEWFKVLAPYVRAGSYITFDGEDGHIWCYYFDGKTCTEHDGVIVFPTISDIDNQRGGISICT